MPSFRIQLYAFALLGTILFEAYSWHSLTTKAVDLNNSDDFFKKHVGGFFQALFIVFSIPLIILTVLTSLFGLLWLPHRSTFICGALGFHHAIWAFWSVFGLEHNPSLIFGVASHAILLFYFIFSSGNQEDQKLEGAQVDGLNNGIKKVQWPIICTTVRSEWWLCRAISI